jgi:DNA-binding response OmpR family regulator
MTSGEPEVIANHETRIQTILLVEDDEDIGEFITQALKGEMPYAVLHVTDAAHALDAVSSIKPGLFMLDYQLPDINGLELHDRLHAIKNLETIPTLMVSANFPSRKEMQKRHITFLRKPFDLNDLFKIVEKLLPKRVE